MTSPSNQGVPKTFLYGLVNPTPATEADIGTWVPIVTNADGNLSVQAEAQPRPAATVFTDVNVTSAQPNTLQNDSLDPGSDSVLTVMAQDMNSFPLVFNEYAANNGFWNLQRGNQNPTILASAARTATVDSADFINHNARGAHFIINVTAITATPSIMVGIQGKDPVSAGYYDLLVSTAITTTGITVLKIYPGITTIPNGAASDILPWQFRVRVEHADADSITYSVAANMVV